MAATVGMPLRSKVSCEQQVPGDFTRVAESCSRDRAEDSA
jgi:hypothetical protein